MNAYQLKLAHDYSQDEIKNIHNRQDKLSQEDKDLIDFYTKMLENIPEEESSGDMSFLLEEYEDLSDLRKKSTGRIL